MVAPWPKLELSAQEHEALVAVVRRGADWKSRERAQTLLHLGAGRSRQQTADELQLHPQTVTSTRMAWLQEGQASLADKPRAGAPRKLRAEHEQQLVQWAQAQPLSAPELAAKLQASGAPKMHLNTVRKGLRRAGLSARRTRASLQTAATRPLLSARA